MFAELRDNPMDSIRKGTGCDACRGTGYRGRRGIFELLPVSESIRGQIQSRSNASMIQAKARERGLKLMREDGIQKVMDGNTTLDEVARVTVAYN